jgi:hypothetical protein
MSSLNKPRFRNEVHDIANQLMHLMEHRERLLEAETIWALDSALARLGGFAGCDKIK